MNVSPGDVFGKLTVIEAGDIKKRHRYFICQCECGCIKPIRTYSLISGHTKSCGCSCQKHGMAKTPEYAIWKSMKARCLIPTNKAYHNYGGRGIKVCSRWDSFELFLEDMGLRPSSKHSIDRIDTNDNYCPENCRWITRTIQNNNTRRNHFIEYKGEVKTIAQWAKLLGFNKQSLWNRINRGWSIQDALTTPIGER